MTRITERVLAAAREAGTREGVDPAVLLAVALVETGGRSLARVGARFEPLIRFEGHYFHRLLPEALRAQARAAGLAHPRAGAVANPPGQEGRWRLLDLAAALDREAAFASTSWGLGQVMGAHGKRLGYNSAQALAEAARATVAGQLTVAARFLKLGALDRMLAAGDFAGFARRYNGPGFRANRYDAKIRAAWREARTALREAGTAGAGA